MVKPDGVQRGVVGNIINRFEQKGYLLKGLKLITPPKSLLEEHYESLKAKVRARVAYSLARRRSVCVACESLSL